MKRKYKIGRIPIDAYENFARKRNALQEILKEEKINKNVKLADTLRFFSQKKIDIYNSEVVTYFKNRRKKLKLI